MIEGKTKKEEDKRNEVGHRLGGKRKDPDEVKKTVTINLKYKVIKEIEKDGVVKQVIEQLVNEKYLKEQ